MLIFIIHYFSLFASLQASSVSKQVELSASVASTSDSSRPAGGSRQGSRLSIASGSGRRSGVGGGSGRRSGVGGGSGRRSRVGGGSASGSGIGGGSQNEVLGGHQEEWVSTAFVLASSVAANHRSNVCWEYNDYFCFLGLIGNPRSSTRREGGPKQTDEKEFSEVLRPIYTLVNWYTLDKSGGCCKYQFQTYQRYGQPNGLSPTEYINKAFDLESVPDKQLNYLVAEYNKQLCYNEIIRVGFGTGGFKRHGGITDLDYILPTTGNYFNDSTVTFSYPNVTKELTFDRFKAIVLCADQSWICDVWPVKQTFSVEFIEQRGTFRNT